MFMSATLWSKQHWIWSNWPSKKQRTNLINNCIDTQDYDGNFDSILFHLTITFGGKNYDNFARYLNMKYEATNRRIYPKYLEEKLQKYHIAIISLCISKSRSSEFEAIKLWML